MAYYKTDCLTDSLKRLFTGVEREILFRFIPGMNRFQAGK